MSVSFATDILPLFTAMDVAHMKELGVPLDDYGYMSQATNATAVLNQVASGKMPPSSSGEPPWSAVPIAMFKDWIAGGRQP